MINNTILFEVQKNKKTIGYGDINEFSWKYVYFLPLTKSYRWSIFLIKVWKTNNKVEINKWTYERRASFFKED